MIITITDFPLIHLKNECRYMNNAKRLLIFFPIENY